MLPPELPVKSKYRGWLRLYTVLVGVSLLIGGTQFTVHFGDYQPAGHKWWLVPEAEMYIDDEVQDQYAAPLLHELAFGAIDLEHSTLGNIRLACAKAFFDLYNSEVIEQIRARCTLSHSFHQYLSALPKQIDRYDNPTGAVDLAMAKAIGTTIGHLSRPENLLVQRVAAAGEPVGFTQSVTQALHRLALRQYSAYVWIVALANVIFWVFVAPSLVIMGSWIASRTRLLRWIVAGFRQEQSHGVTPLSVISERSPQERIWPSRGLRLVGMGLMTLWMTYGLLHVLFGSWLFPERAGYEVVGGFLQFGVALSAFLWLRRRHTSAQKNEIDHSIPAGKQ
jgi:hypothetical protein